MAKGQSEKKRQLKESFQQNVLSGGYDSVWGNFRDFFLKNPVRPTLVSLKTLREREDLTERILQRLDVPVSDYSVLNVHKIGLNVPGRYVFEELLQWDGNSPFWPNRIARVERIAKQIEHIQIYLLGLERLAARYGGKWSLFKLIRLFDLDSMRIQSLPEKADRDNARFLLYQCSGGYPIGIFSIYVRSSIEALQENEQTQLFAIVAFNFYGKKQWFFSRLINYMWETIHNRVTSNILNRMKLLFEGQFNRIIKDLERPPAND